MSDTYLNKAGLTYFWSKLKAWASGLFVHRTGAETVHDLKVFSSSNSSNRTNGLVVQCLDIDRGVAPSVDRFCSLSFADKDFDAESSPSESDVTASRLATIDYAARSTGRVDFQFFVLDPQSSGNEGLRFRIGYEADHTQFFVGPSTKDNPYSGEIITYDWLPKDTRLVHTTGAETVGGSKTFANNWTAFSGTDPNVALDNTVAVRTTTPSSLLRWRVMPRDKNGDAFGALCWSQRTSGSSDVHLDVCNSNAAFARFYLGWDGNGVAYATAPSTSASRSEATDIVTRDWIPNDTRIVHTTGDETIGGIKNFSKAIIQNYEGDYCLSKAVIDFVKGAADPSTSKIGGYCVFEKGQSNYYYDNRIVAFEGIVDSSGSVTAEVVAYKNQAANHTAASLMVIFPKGAASTAVYVRSPMIRPHATNTYSLGTGNYRWTNVYINATAVSTSDERLKHNIESVPDEVLDAWADLEWLQFQMLDSVQKKGVSEARLHTGAIAQRIAELFARHGLDASRYGLFCHDEWEQTQEVRGADGEVRTPYQAAGDMYSLRYAEALCMEAAYMRRENARLKKRIADLEERLAALELKIS